MSSRIVSKRGVVRPMLWLAGPVLVEQMLTALVGFVDTWLTGHFVPGEAPLAAIGVMAYTMWLLPNLFASVAIGATALIARFTGGGEQRLARQVMHQSLLCGVVMSAALMAILWLCDTAYITGLNMQGEAADLALRYLRYLIPVLPAVMVVQIGVACLRGAGDTISGLVAMIGLNFVNVLVGAILVVGWGPLPRLGWDGLAMGTASGYVTGALIVWLWLLVGRAGLRLQISEFRPRVDVIRRLFRVGIPGGADVAAVLACHLWFVRIINGLGTLPASAHMLAVRVESLAFLPGTAFQVAAATMVGQFLGANDRPRAIRGVLAACVAGGGVMIAAGLLFFFGAEEFTQFFTGSKEHPTARAAVPLLRLAAWAMPSLALTMVLSGALRGAGDTRWPFLITLLGLLGVRIPLAMYLSRHSLPLGPLGVTIPAGVYGAWCAMVADLVVRTVLSVGRFVHGGWQHTKV